MDSLLEQWNKARARRFKGYKSMASTVAAIEKIVKTWEPIAKSVDPDYERPSRPRDQRLADVDPDRPAAWQDELRRGIVGKQGTNQWNKPNTPPHMTRKERDHLYSMMHSKPRDLPLLKMWFKKDKQKAQLQRDKDLANGMRAIHANLGRPARKPRPAKQSKSDALVSAISRLVDYANHPYTDEG